MKIQILTLCSALVASSVCSGQPYNASAESLFPELKNIYLQAEQNSYQFYNIDNNLLNAQINKKLSRTNNYPYISLNTGAGMSYSSQYDEPSYGVNDLSLGLGYTLYQWGAKSAQHRMADNQYRIAEIDYSIGLQNTAAQIRTAFFQLIIQKIRMQEVELNVEIAQSRLDQDTLRFEEGKLSKENYERSVISRRRFMGDLENIKRQYKNLLDDFRKLTGIPDYDESRIPTSIPAIPSFDNRVVDAARNIETSQFADVLRVQKTDLILANAEESIVTTQSGNRPRIGLGAGFGLGLEPSLLDKERILDNGKTERYKESEHVYRYNVNVSFNWTIADGGYTSGRVDAAYAYRRKMIEDYRELLESLRLEKQRGIEDLIYKFERLQFAEDEYRLALNDYEKSKDEHQRGRLSILDFKHAELNRISQEINISNQRMDYILTFSRFLTWMNQDPILEILPPAAEKDTQRLIKLAKETSLQD